MPTLIPFETRPGNRDTVAPGTKATILDVTAPRAQRRPGGKDARSAASARRWDPAFHVDLLTF